MKSFLAGFLAVVILTGMVGGLWYFKNEEKSKGVVQATPEGKAVKTVAPTQAAGAVGQKTSAPTVKPTVAPASPAGNLTVNFSKEGELVSREGNWTLFFDEPGRLALSVNLKFDNSSKCDTGACDTSKFTEGTRVLVRGNKAGDEVRVVTMEGK